MMRLVIRIGALCSLTFLGVAGAVSAPPAAPVSSHETAARELYRLAGGDKLAQAGADAMMGLFRENPELAPYEDVIRAWTQKVFAGDDFELEIAKLYMAAFSEAELRELTTFYKTPIGQKALATLPELMKKGAELGMRRGQEHSAELGEMLEKARREREGQGLLDDKAAQKRTVADLRNVGTAMMSWLTDQDIEADEQSPAEKKESPRADLTKYSQLSREELEKILVPQYLQSLPETDGWGHPYEYYLDAASPGVSHVLAIRSAGRDGKFAATDYEVGPYPPDDFDEDIVWMDGYFVRWPQAK